MPKSWCKDMDIALKNFWWGYSEERNRNLSLKSWSSICLLKGAGGFGIRRMSEINQALLVKLVWKMLTDQGSLWVQVLHGKYLRDRGFWHVEAIGNSSWLWKSIVNSHDVLKARLCYQVGGGI